MRIFLCKAFLIQSPLLGENLRIRERHPCQHHLTLGPAPPCTAFASKSLLGVQRLSRETAEPTHTLIVI